MNVTDTAKPERPVSTRLPGGFQRFCRMVTRTSGHPTAFGVALAIIVIWALAGPFFRFSNTWLLVMATIANLITCLMIFLIRSAQDRESAAVQLKLDELIRATKEARNTLLDIEALSEGELDRIKARFERLAHKARAESSAWPAGTAHAEQQIDQAVIAPVGAGAPPPKEFVL